MSIAGRKRVFKEVQGILYHVDLLNKTKDASCLTKSTLLQQRLHNEFGIESRRMCCRFAVKDLPLPPELLAMATRSHAQHCYLEVHIPETGRWVIVDPTWDIGLKDAGFRVVESWDGIKPTRLGVVPLQAYSPEESAYRFSFDENRSQSSRKVFHERHERFGNAVNQWLEQQRCPVGVLQYA